MTETFRLTRCDYKGQEGLAGLGGGDFEGRCRGFRRGQEKSFQCVIWPLQLGHSDIVVVVADIVNVKLERLLFNLNFESRKIGVVTVTGALVIQCLSKGLLFQVSKSRGFHCRQVRNTRFNALLSILRTVDHALFKEVRSLTVSTNSSHDLRFESLTVRRAMARRRLYSMRL